LVKSDILAGSTAGDAMVAKEPPPADLARRAAELEAHFRQGLAMATELRLDLEGRIGGDPSRPPSRMPPAKKTAS
jgi:hypothetical protein